MITLGFEAKRAFKNFSGLGNYSRSLLRALADHHPQYRYLLYTPPYAPHPVLSPVEQPDMRICLPQGPGRIFPSLWRSYGVGSRLAKDGVALFHGLSGELPYGIPRRILTVVTMHDVIFMRYPQYYKPVDRYFYERKFRYACRRADKIIAISQQTANDIIHYLGADPQKIEIVYQGCDPQFYEPAGAEACAAVRAKYKLPEQFILSVGTIEERKNALSIVEALPLLLENCHLLLLGKATPYLQKVLAAVARLGLGSRVHFLHSALFSDFPAIYACARALVYPSVFEGFGIPVLEGLNVGIPVVTSNISSMPEAGGDAAAYVNPLDAKEIAYTLRNILEKPDLANEMRVKGFAHALLFREDKVAQNVHEVYHQLLSK